jgi:hypothetical protein
MFSCGYRSNVQAVAEDGGLPPHTGGGSHLGARAPSREGKGLWFLQVPLLELQRRYSENSRNYKTTSAGNALRPIPLLFYGWRGPGRRFSTGRNLGS